METLRMGTFETNSSSTHCMTIMSEEEYDKFKSGLYYWDRSYDKIVTTDTMYQAYLDWEKKADEKDKLSKPMSIDQFVTCLETKKSGKYPDNDEMKFRIKEFETFIESTEYCSLDTLGNDYEYESCSKTVGDQTVVAFAYYGYC